MSFYSLQALMNFPTTTLLVDDNSIFLSSLSLTMANHIPLKLFDNPRKALDLLQKIPTISDYYKNKLAQLYSSEPEAPILLKLYEESYNLERFSYISTLIVDYSMPNLNGCELCQAIKHIPINKIMLTAEADHHKAVELFNNGLIDYFIIKNSPSMKDELKQAIKKSQDDYFKQAATPLFNYLCQSSISFIPDEIESIHRKFLSNFPSNHFAEYYLLDTSGSMLFIDFYGNSKWLILKTNKEIESYYDIALNHDAPDRIIRSLEEKTATPFFLTDNDHQISAQDWTLYQLDGVSDQYLYSTNYNAQLPNKIKSFDDYLKQESDQHFYDAK